MRKLLGATAIVSAMLAMSMGAHAADMAMKAPMPAPLPVLFTWTGFYLGGNIGGAWTSRRVTDSFFGIDFSRSSDGVFIGGGQIGYNWQVAPNFVLGIEGDIDGIANKSGGASAVVPGVGTIAATGNADGNWVSTIAARFGYANDHWLFYGKAGGGWLSGSGNVTLTNLNTGASTAIAGIGSTRSGYLLGGGIEYAITNNWTIKGEYDYLGLSGSRSFVVPVGSTFLVGDTFTRSGRNFQMFKIGFNYLFR